MSMNKILVHAQYYENYNVGPEGFNMYGDKQPHWKPKGGHTFQIEMDADLLMFSDPAEVFGKMLEKQNSIAERFEYVDYEVQWQEPTLLGSQEDYIKANQELNPELA